MIYQTAHERAEHRRKLEAPGRYTICRPCLLGHHTECSWEQCCCICNELHHAEEAPRRWRAVKSAAPDLDLDLMTRFKDPLLVLAMAAYWSQPRHREAGLLRAVLAR